VLRAGLTEVLVTGIEIRWIKVRARPIGIPDAPLGVAWLALPPSMMSLSSAVSSSSGQG
jgi:hypothetical protein